MVSAAAVSVVSPAGVLEDGGTGGWGGKGRCGPSLPPYCSVIWAVLSKIRFTHKYRPINYDRGVCDADWRSLDGGWEFPERRWGRRAAGSPSSALVNCRMSGAASNFVGYGFVVDGRTGRP